MTKETLPTAFIYRRMHSLMGIWLTIFLMEHLLVNSQAAYFFGENGQGFIRAVNSIHDLPYLPIIELAILGLPIFVHMVLGFKYLRSAKYNSFGNSGTTPYLPYSRNRAYTWQRITSWLLVFGIILHVVQMRFLDYPSNASVQGQNYYMVLVNLDEGIYTLAKRLDVELYDQNRIKIESEHDLHPDLTAPGFAQEWIDSFKGIFSKPAEKALSQSKIEKLLENQKTDETDHFIETLEKYRVKRGQAIAVSKDFGTAELLMIRETFKIPIMIALYTLFVLAACFHGFNGLWTFLISFGVITSEKARINFLRFSYLLMFVFSFLGLSAIYASYWINLKQ